MLKYFLYLVLAAIVIGAVAGGAHLYRVAQKNKKEMAPYQGEPIKVTKTFGKSLVIYYSLSGHTRDIAQRISQKIGADIYEIKTAQQLDKYPWFYLNLRSQLKKGEFPALAGDMPDLSRYDIIFVGFPVWWYTMATPGHSFLRQVDFMGKQVVPFSTQGSNFGTFFTDFAKTAQNAEILSGNSFNNLPAKYDSAVDNKIAVWLNELQ